MPRNQMLFAVAQTVALSALGWIISHHLLNNVYQNASEHHLWREFMNAIELIENASTNAALDKTIGAGNFSTNGTSVHANATSFNITLSDSHETFYWKTLPRDILFTIVIMPFYYYWHIWLEKSFPARPRPTSASLFSKESLVKGEPVPHEEDIIQKWIAQGKIRRASLSWWNTFIKWILNMVVGSLWMTALEGVLHELWAFRLPKTSLSAMKWNALFVAVGSFFGITPLSTLVAFVVLPAHQRIVFEAGAQAVWEIFYSTFLGLILPWLANTQIMSQLVGNITEGARNETLKAQSNLGYVPIVPDEL